MVDVAAGSEAGTRSDAPRGYPDGACCAVVRRPGCRSGPNGVLRHRPRAARRPGPRGDGRRPRPDGPLPAQMAGRGARPGLLRLERAGLADRRPCRGGNPVGPVRLGVADVGGQRGSRAASAQHQRRKARVAELPEGGRVALRARRHLLGQQVQAGLPGRRPGRADPVLAGLERAQPEEVLQPGNKGPAVRPEIRSAACHLQRRDQGQGSAGPGRPRRNAQLRGRDGLEIPAQPLRGGRGQGRLRRSCPAPLWVRPGSDSRCDQHVQRRDEEQRRPRPRRCG